MNGTSSLLKSKMWIPFISSKMHSNTHTGDQWEALMRAASVSTQERADHLEGPEDSPILPGAAIESTHRVYPSKYTKN